MYDVEESYSKNAHAAKMGSKIARGRLIHKRKNRNASYSEGVNYLMNHQASSKNGFGVFFTLNELAPDNKKRFRPKLNHRYKDRAQFIMEQTIF